MKKVNKTKAQSSPKPSKQCFEERQAPRGKNVNASTSGVNSRNVSKKYFPFKRTPSGNMIVDSNQIAFQSSNLEALLPDQVNASIKIKVENKYNQSCSKKDFPSDLKGKSNPVREDKGKNLESLGYGLEEPVQLNASKKLDLLQEFNRRVHNRINTDVVVQVSNKVFHCHKVVLQIYSPFFDENRDQYIIKLPKKVTPEAFLSLYEWMISSENDSIQLPNSSTYVLELFCAARLLSIKDLEEQFWSIIVNDSLFTEDTAFVLYRKARVMGIKTVMDLMIPRVMRFFLPLVASQDFLDLKLEELIALLKSNYICVTSEVEVLMAGVRWLYGNFASRHHLAIEVMKCVRFGLISPWQLVDIKRNPDNSEILEIISNAEILQMVDDGLAYVIIKYWHGNNSQNYYHWIDVLGLAEPVDRNWIGEEINHVTYKDFLKYLEQFTLPKDQMFQQLTAMQSQHRPGEDFRSFDVPSTSGISGVTVSYDNVKGELEKNQRPKLEFPLPYTLKDFVKNQDNLQDRNQDSNKNKSQEVPLKISKDSYRVKPLNINKDGHKDKNQNLLKINLDGFRKKNKDKIASYEAPDEPNEYDTAERDPQGEIDSIHNQITKTSIEARDSFVSEPTEDTNDYDTPERDSHGEIDSVHSKITKTNIGARDSLISLKSRFNEKRQSIAAAYLAAATAALSSGQQSFSASEVAPSSRLPNSHDVHSSRHPRNQQHSNGSLEISLYNHSKEILAMANINKLSCSILGPPNKIYITENSLFNWDRETILIFGGMDPHTTFGTGRNTGKDIYRFDPITNAWDNVGELPEPRHHHSVAFLKARVYLVGGADPRDDDVRGKSVVTSTVWSFEPVSRAWYSESGLAIPRKNFGLVVHKMALYAIGGQDKKGRVLRSVEKFDPLTGSWTEMRPLSVARMAVATAKYREYIWVAGGMTGDKKEPVSRIVECYSSYTNTWTQIQNLRSPRCFATMFAMNDKLYIIGGAGKVTDKDKTASSLAEIDIWDWSNRNWQLYTELSIPRHGHAMAYLGPQIIIIGGVTTIYMRALNNVESYCCERCSWIRGVSPLPSPLSGHGSVTLPPASLMCI